MRTASLLATIVAWCAATTNFISALELVKRENGAPRTLAFPIQRRQTTKPVLSPALRRRQGKTLSETLTNGEVRYSAPCCPRPY